MLRACERDAAELLGRLGGAETLAVALIVGSGAGALEINAAMSSDVDEAGEDDVDEAREGVAVAGMAEVRLGTTTAPSGSSLVGAASIVAADDGHAMSIYRCT